MKIWKYGIIVMIALFIPALTVYAAEDSGSSPEYREFSELKGKTVSMLSGAPFEELVSEKAPESRGQVP